MQGNTLIINYQLSIINLSPLNRCGAGDCAFVIANLEERYIISLFVADGQHLTQAALLRKMNIKAEWAWFGQVLNR